MTSLTAAHRGYEYQDLLVACRLVEMLLGTVVEARIDEKLTADDDRFDDLSLALSSAGGSVIAIPIETLTPEAMCPAAAWDVVSFDW